tara:strand:- start:760 stop:1278 length:519 start_codon:yes stop_codon:yes gene_type:complete
MSYIVERITSLDEAVFERLYSTSEEKINAGNMTTHETLPETYRKDSTKEYLYKVLAEGFVLQVKKDDVIVFVAGGTLEGLTWNCLVFLVGQDANGSKSFVYDTDWLVAMRDFHKSMEDVYTVQEYKQATNRTAAKHYDAMIEIADNDNRFTHTKEAAKVDIDYRLRTLSEIE